MGCALFQIAGYPARIVVLADTETAYSGHVITEVYRHGVWGAVYTATGVLYTEANGHPMSSAAIRGMGEPQFRCAAVANYSVWEAQRYTYEVSGINSYYRSILAMSQQG